MILSLTDDGHRCFLHYGRQLILAQRITQISHMDSFAAPIDFVNQLSRVILTQQQASQWESNHRLWNFKQSPANFTL